MRGAHVDGLEGREGRERSAALGQLQKNPPFAPTRARPRWRLRGTCTMHRCVAVVKCSEVDNQLLKWTLMGFAGSGALLALSGGDGGGGGDSEAN